MKAVRLGEIAKMIGAELYGGDPEFLLTGIATLDRAVMGQVSFLANPQYVKLLKNTQASAVILAADMAQDCKTAALIMKNPYLGFAKATQLFDSSPKAAPGIHPSAVVHPSASIHASVSIGAYAVIEEGVTLQEKVIIGAHCYIGQNSHIGNSSQLWPRVTLYHGVNIGQYCIIHSGVVIGADGFGLAKDQDRWEKISQLGGVLIGDHVEIGANTTIDRGALENTVLEEGVKLDNQIQIGHNVKIGAHTAIAGCSGIAGSTKIGKYCTIAAAVGIAGHLEITDSVQVTAMSLISRSITKPGVYSSGTPMDDYQQWKKNAARFRRLDEMAKRLQHLEKRVSEKENKVNTL